MEPERPMEEPTLALLVRAAWLQVSPVCSYSVCTLLHLHLALVPLLSPPGCLMHQPCLSAPCCLLRGRSWQHSAVLWGQTLSLTLHPFPL